jgi:hypothetical protein
MKIKDSITVCNCGLPKHSHNVRHPFTKMNIGKLPKYAKIKGTIMKLYPNNNHFLSIQEGTPIYWRDAGMWGATISINDGKLRALSCGVYYDVIPVTYNEWRKSNAGYI